ncbi:hypothetical protein J4733_20395 [Klebsiella pneumoniae]|uniref:Uncharacterized protein n=1 Tax=Klebsiella pneumoniae TaxID=573 RepID=A0A939NRQ3_KLEPN|nr:hypothetical protein [Klebsiella pneumoniae]
MGHNEKSTIIMLVVAIVAVAGTSLAGGDRRGDIAELSYPINKLTLYTHVIRRGILGPGNKNSGRSKDENRSCYR